MVCAVVHVKFKQRKIKYGRCLFSDKNQMNSKQVLKNEREIGTDRHSTCNRISNVVRREQCPTIEYEFLVVCHFLCLTHAQLYTLYRFGILVNFSA